MTPRIRRARDADLPAIVALGGAEEGLSLLPSHYEQMIGAEAPGSSQVLVAEGDGRILAFSACSRVLDEATLLAMAVEPAWRRRGLGQRLLAATLEALTRDQAAARCLLEVRASNAAAIGLYRRNGFREDGRRRHYYPGRGTLGREDAVLMSRPLEGAHAGTGNG